MHYTHTHHTHTARTHAPHTHNACAGEECVQYVRREQFDFLAEPSGELFGVGSAPVLERGV